MRKIIVVTVIAVLFLIVTGIPVFNQPVVFPSLMAVPRSIRT